MRSRLLITLCLLLAVIGLALFLIRGGGEKPAPTDVPLTRMAAAAINQIRIIRKDQDEIRFEKQSGRWIMQHPYQLRASDLRINTLLNLLNAHSYAQYNSKDTQLSRFLLDQPQVSIEYNGARIDFGDTNPLGEQRYVLYNNVVHIINDVLFQQLQAPAYFFINTRLLPERTTITAISLPGHVIRRHQAVWAVEPTSTISADKIVELVNAWRDADAISVSKYEDTTQHDSVRIELEKQASIDFVIVHAPPQLILARPDLGIQYHLGNDDADRMFLKITTPEQKEGGSAPVK